MEQGRWRSAEDQASKEQKNSIDICGRTIVGALNFRLGAAGEVVGCSCQQTSPKLEYYVGNRGSHEAAGGVVVLGKEYSGTIEGGTTARLAVSGKKNSNHGPIGKTS